MAWDEGWREPSEEESALFRRLLEVDFVGREEVRAQWSDALVRPVPGCEQHCGSLEIRTAKHDRIPLNGAILPVEARGYDQDGMPIEVLVHLREGWLRELEIVVYGDRLPALPRPQELELDLYERD